MYFPMFWNKAGGGIAADVLPGNAHSKPPAAQVRSVRYLCITGTIYRKKTVPERKYPPEFSLS